MTFKELGLVEPILRALQDQGYERPTPIQAQAIPVLLEGKDLLGCAQTGTGKTAAFSIPIVQDLYNRQPPKGKRRIKTLVVTPTRELAIQIGENFSAYAKYTDIKNTVIFGGVKQTSQVYALHQGIDVLVATPGRLLDLINQRYISLDHVEHFVLDEADQMLDMGFIHDIKKLLKLLPQKRQSLFFSATMPSAIVKLSNEILGNPARVTIEPEKTTAEKVEQRIYHVNKMNKTKLLIDLLSNELNDATLVFSRTKHGANKIVKDLDKAGIKSAAIHGNKSQAARQRALQQFKDGDLHALIATDIAARGIDIDELNYVVNYDLPNVPESYVHRIGRTGRAGASGLAVSFCMLEERPFLKDIEKLIRTSIPVVEVHEFEFKMEDAAEPSLKKQGGGGRSQGRSNKPKSGGGNSSSRSSGGNRNNNRNRSR
ncbi:DEAD/DEAH box helicase [Nonlabens sp. Ci31]|jgi:ATP-dependent RNA helicase RhlE|uniref:DEAD/DEAH box helicase n=1 Tax=Nonlabens sp. Ci31 TaxID=2608253 RepID=UPI0014642713|nr:DEAD/DEAH box helicase [Nonlabens sp. Ci31]QJP35778.1 DEAD/DEAH box helicase [Nonlabens sp. Ci31]